jgi:DNA replicative helicase MCM subunit Mcm2 (Cdc46/Mcm family)
MHMSSNVFQILQEQVKHMNFGSLPRSIQVTLRDDLVSTVNPGDDVCITYVIDNSVTYSLHEYGAWINVQGKYFIKLKAAH